MMVRKMNLGVFTAGLVGVGMLFGCGGHNRTVKIPDSVVEKPSQRGSRKSSMTPYVVKMSDGQRTWQIEIPMEEGSPSFSASIPLDLGKVANSPPNLPATEADREIIDAKKRAGETVPKAKPGEPLKATSYLGGIARVRNLFSRRQYEIALVELVSLDRQYPDDERILEMKGTLYKKLGRIEEAKEAWNRVLVVNPDNQVVARALEDIEDLEEME